MADSGSPAPASSPRGDQPLPLPEPGRREGERFVASHLRHLVDTSGSFSSPVVRGGQRAADTALAELDLNGYAAARGEAYPQPRRRVSNLSPYIRHGLLSLPSVWRHLDSAGGDIDDRAAFARSLLWQEYARHRYAADTTRVVAPKAAPTDRVATDRVAADDGDRRGRGEGDDRVWDKRLGCLQVTLDELEEDGRLVDEGRRWLAAHWVNRHGRSWPQGEDYFFSHLLDGSRAANRLAWSSAAAGGPDGVARFSRWEVEARAPGLCASCELVHRCPIELPLEPAQPDPARTRTAPAGAVTPAAGPSATPVALFAGPVASGRGHRDDDDDGDDAGAAVRPAAVWLTAESLGDDDPALVAHRDLPAVFVFDEPLLARVRLSAKRLVFLVETLAELATRRRLELVLGDPRTALAERPLAVTHAPVPGFQRRAAALDVVDRRPWPWLVVPTVEAGVDGAAWCDEALRTLDAHRGESVGHDRECNTTVNWP